MSLPTTLGRRSRSLLLVSLAISVFGLSTAGARAATVTVGSPLTAAFEPQFCSLTTTCTGLMGSLPESGALATSPVDGTIVRWRILKGSPGRQFKLRVLTPTGGIGYTATGTSAPGSPIGEGVEAFSTALPIK